MKDFPQKFGRYLLEKKIATGGMAEIFKAKLVGVEGFEKTVVIKRILPFWSQRQDFIKMLVDEAKVLVHLNHPNIVQVYELGRVGADYFIAMEFVDGVDLRRLLTTLKQEKINLPGELAVSIIGQVLRGLDYAHQRTLRDRGQLKIVHRDISPQNILLSFSGEVKVTDFGIAKAITQSHETQTGVLKGKYAYMSPEQARGRELDGRSDLFSCGLVLYELLFHERAFPGKNDIQILDRVRRAHISWPQDKVQGLSLGLKTLLVKALQVDIHQRFATAGKFYRALTDLQGMKWEAPVPSLKSFMEGTFKKFETSKASEGEAITEGGPDGQRKTKVAPSSIEATVSLVESETHLNQNTLMDDFFNEKKQPLERPNKKFSFKFLPTALVIFWLFLGGTLAYWVVQSFRAGESPTSDSKPIDPDAQNKIAGVALLGSPLPSPSPLADDRSRIPIPPPSGFFDIQVKPQQAQLKIQFPGGEKEGEGHLSLGDLSIGTSLVVQATLKGYIPQKKTFKISPDQASVKEVIHLKKVEPQRGTLRVNAVPWGRVELPGAFKGGETPLVRKNLPVGKYRVRVSNPNVGQTLTATAVIRPGRTTRCQADFERKAQLRCH